MKLTMDEELRMMVVVEDCLMMIRAAPGQRCLMEQQAAVPSVGEMSAEEQVSQSE